MPRTPGALNKPKYINVKLRDLNRVFGPDSVIQVAAHYWHFLYNNETTISEVQSIKNDYPVEKKDPPITYREIE